MKSLNSLYLLSFILHLTSSSSDWCYQSQNTCDEPCNGPALWKEGHEECGHNKQSPINIVTKRTNADERLKPLKLAGYHTAFDTTVTNNGHSVVLDIPVAATISGGNLEDTYKAVQMHFHWGADGALGSEHTIDGEQYPMELHIVHIKEKYTGIKEALEDPSGIAVLGFLFEESNSQNNHYNTFIESLGTVQDKDQSTGLSSVSLKQFILSEEHMIHYYRYEGSLTTPGCAEAVIWTVFEKPIPLSKEQLLALSSLKFHDGTPMVGNYRPVQPINGRPVYRSSSAVVLASAVLLFISIATALSLSHPN